MIFANISVTESNDDTFLVLKEEGYSFIAFGLQKHV